MDWRDLVRSTLDENVTQTEFSETQQFRSSRLAEKEHELELIAQILSEYFDADERVTAWMRMTGKTKRTYYRRKSEYLNRSFNPNC